MQLHELDAPLASVFTRRQRQRHTVRWTPDDRPQQIDSHTTRFTCHTKRVKAGPTFSAHSSHCRSIKGHSSGVLFRRPHSTDDEVGHCLSHCAEKTSEMNAPAERC